MAAKTQKTELPDDIIFDQILPRIPAKSVIELKCVCRKWYSTISSRNFAKTYLRHPFSLSSRSVLTNNYFSSIESFDLAAQDDIKLMVLPYPNFGNSSAPYDADFNLGCIDGCLCAWASVETLG